MFLHDIYKLQCSVGCCVHVAPSALRSRGCERLMRVCVCVCILCVWVYVCVTLCCWRCRAAEGPGCVLRRESESLGVQRRGSERQGAPPSQSSPTRGRPPALCVHASPGAMEHAWTRRVRELCPAMKQLGAVWGINTTHSDFSSDWAYLNTSN